MRSLISFAVALAAAAAIGLPALPEAYRAGAGWLAGLGFAGAALLLGIAAVRLSTARGAREKAQLAAYRHLIENLQDAVLRFSRAGDLLFASRSAETLLGCRRYELSGAGLLERIHILDRPAYLKAFAEANRDGVARRVEMRMRRDSAEARAAQFVWMDVALSPVTDEAVPGGRHEIVALLRDISERKDHEIDMRQARVEAEDASRAKSRFLATIGHELRTPLNAIVGFSEMLTSGVVGELAPTHREYAKLIHQSGRHLVEVVTMLLDMSRLEAGKFELQTEGFAPETLLEPCLKMVETMARAREVELVAQVPPGLPLLVADEGACRQILINLLSNAVKFSHERAKVTVALRRQGRFLNISVADRGIGMDVEAVSHIGEPFFQAQDGLARRYEGTGLGLSIVKGLVELHGGTLHTASTPGEGTTMTVLLPINGPAIKLEDTTAVTALHRDPIPPHEPLWHDEKRRAQ